MSIKVLLADDEEQFAATLAERLETRGFDVRVCFSGDGAISKLDEKEADVVVLDVMMPGMDGIEALRQIRQAHPLTEVIMLTGHATVETGIEGMKLGAYDYLIKPTEIDDLSQKIKKAYKRKAEHEERIRQAEVDRIVKSKGW
jgi:DNA-binding response OmpR family regulator